jgi:hypothetical protein
MPLGERSPVEVDVLNECFKRGLGGPVTIFRGVSDSVLAASQNLIAEGLIAGEHYKEESGLRILAVWITPTGAEYLKNAGRAAQG